MQSGLDPQHVVAGERTAVLDAGSGGGASVSLNPIANMDNAGMLHVPVGGAGYWTTTYLDQVDDIDFTVDGHDALQITVSVPTPGYRIGFFAANDPIPGHRASTLKTMQQSGTYLFPYAEFTPYNGEAMPNFAALDSLYMYVAPPFLQGASPIEANVGISDVRTTKVPEPSSGLFAVVVAVTAFAPRKKRMTKNPGA
jgi:hypothetical protein